MCPTVTVDLADGEHVIAVVAFLLIEDVERHDQQVQMTATDGLAGVTIRGLVEVGRDVMLADQRKDFT